MDVIFGPRRAEPGTYDAWTSIVRAMDPRFAFTDPPLRHRQSRRTPPAPGHWTVLCTSRAA
jgi:hypothetical protein